MLVFGMGMDATARRRWFGAVVLFGAVAMLVCGQTVLQGRMQPWLLVIYWPICFILTGLAVVAALRDVRALQDRARQEQRDLLESTLKEIETEAKSRAGSSQRNNGKP